jgi:hypothetical protein
MWLEYIVWIVLFKGHLCHGYEILRVIPLNSTFYKLVPEFDLPCLLTPSSFSIITDKSEF